MLNWYKTNNSPQNKANLRKNLEKNRQIHNNRG